MYSNQKTCSVARWISNNKELYYTIKAFVRYTDFVAHMSELGITSTPDGVSLSDAALDHEELSDTILDLGLPELTDDDYFDQAERIDRLDMELLQAVGLADE